jgi:hypothetical protein
LSGGGIRNEDKSGMSFKRIVRLSKDGIRRWNKSIRTVDTAASG